MASVLQNGSMMENNDMKILVVDDEPYIRKSVGEILSDEGYQISEACDSGQCLQYLAENETDLVIMDVQMPGLDGIETFREMVKRKYQADTIIISGHGTIQTAVQAMKIGACDFLEKPFSMEKLKEIVGKVKEKRLGTSASNRRELGKYIVLEELGTGGMATVYKGVHKELNKKVVLKVLHPHLTKDPRFTERFFLEARTTATLSHPNIVRIDDYGEEMGLFYIAMEYISGKPLDDYLKQNDTLSLYESIRIGVKVCGALEHAHARGIIHRDIKPQNILISPEGEVKLVDFGLAKTVESELLKMTQPDQCIGTPHYMSPEQIQGLSVGPASDLFSLGACLFQMATGNLPFEGETSAAVFHRILNEPCKVPKETEDPVRATFLQIIQKCLAKETTERYQSASELKRNLARCLEMNAADTALLREKA